MAMHRSSDPTRSFPIRDYFSRHQVTNIEVLSPGTSYVSALDRHIEFVRPGVSCAVLKKYRVYSRCKDGAVVYHMHTYT